VALYDRLIEDSMRETLLPLFASRPEAEAFDKLVKIAKKDRSKKMRQAAIEALSNSKNPRAPEALSEIVNELEN
jgi:hypothetical protein